MKNESVYVKSHSTERIDDPNDPRGPFQDSENYSVLSAVCKRWERLLARDIWNRFSKCLLSPSLLSQEGQALLLSCCCRADESDAQKFALAGAHVNPAMSSETQFQDPSTLMARKHPSFFQYKSYWLAYAFLTTSLFLCICFRCVFSFSESFVHCSDSLFPLELCSISYSLPYSSLVRCCCYFLMWYFASIFIVKETQSH